MKKFNCPSCGAEVEFKSKISVYAVCRHCASTLVRHDVDVEAIGKMAALPDDMSPLQIGSSGYFNKVPFSIAGRIKVGWEDGAWNEWFVVLGDGRQGWLAEAQGNFSMLFSAENDLSKNDESMVRNLFGRSVDRNSNEWIENMLKMSDKKNSLKGVKKKNLIKRIKHGCLLGSVKIDDVVYNIVDAKQTTCLGCEGELPFEVKQGDFKSHSIDLIGNDNRFASIEFFSESKVAIYSGFNVEWNDMSLSNLRVLEGW